MAGGPQPFATAIDQFKYVVYKDPNWDWRNFDIERDVVLADKADNDTINVPPDLKGFKERGGKLLMYHGWSDPNVAPRASINFYNSAVDKVGGPAKNADWIRLFMEPGMGHCRGGEGPNTFDTVTTLEQWVEQKKAPDQILASHRTNGKIDRTRPLCPYPQVATYKGNGSIDDAANFKCKAK
jgi:feruloyl esterase